jgi:hypothetical protein
MLPPRLAGRLAAARMTRSNTAVGAAAPLDESVARRIDDWCAEDVDDLARLIGRDLSAWHTSPAG